MDDALRTSPLPASAGSPNPALAAVRRYNAALAADCTASDLHDIADALDAAATTAYDLTPGQRMQLRDRADDARARADRGTL